jgi:hypothetical protein
MAKLYWGELHEVGGGHPSHGLPGHNRPTDPDYGVDEGMGPDQGLPIGPPGTPSHPIQPVPPVVPGAPDQGLPSEPGTIWPPLPPGAPTGKVWAFVWIRGYGRHWVILENPPAPGQGLPKPPHAPERPGQLPGQTPPTAQPKS